MNVCSPSSKVVEGTSFENGPKDTVNAATWNWYSVFGMRPCTSIAGVSVVRVSSITDKRRTRTMYRLTIPFLFPRMSGLHSILTMVEVWCVTRTVPGGVDGAACWGGGGGGGRKG